MNSRQRVLNILNRQPVDRLAVDIWHTPEIEKALKEHVGTDDTFTMWQTLGLDKIVWVFMDYKTETGDRAGAQVGARAAGQRTMWGVPLKDVQAGAAQYQEFAEPSMQGYASPADVDNYPFWPNPDDFDYDTAVSLAKKASQDFAVIGPWVSFYEIYCQLRGIEQALLDLVTNPGLVEATLDRVEIIQTEMLLRFYQRAADYLDMAFISDDIGGQTNLLLSPDMWRRHLQPRLQRWCDLVHSFGLKIFYHTDGAVEPLIPSLLDCGIDILNPIQHACPGMEMHALKEKYGARLIFHGGVDNQSVLPFGSVEDVRKETQHCLEILGAGRQGFICCSCHNVQAGTPVENILAMIQTVHES
jgi:uroporphyrinogen decarboxylase